MTCNGPAGSLDLARGDALRLDGLEAVAAEIQQRATLRGTVNTAELGASAASGPLSGVMDGMLRGEQQITVGGRMEVTTPGHGKFQIDEVKVGELRLPAGAVRKLLAHYTGAAEADGGASIDVPFDERPTPQGLGQLVVADAQQGTNLRLDIARYHVNVVLQPPVALVVAEAEAAEQVE